MVVKKRPAPQREAGGDEEAFPRGGSDVLTPFEKRQVEQQAKEELEQELAEGKKPRIKRAKTSEGDAEDAFFHKEAVQGKVNRFVELLKFKNLSVGMKVWGIVLEVTNKGLTVSLPHGLRGNVAAAEASDVLAQLHDPKSKQGAALRATLPDGVLPSLHQLFHVGQYVRCSVTDLADAESAGASQGGKAGSKDAAKRAKHVSLSLQLKHVNSGIEAGALHEGLALPACVRSVEDHGYVLTFGIKGTNGFLRRKDHEQLFGEGAALLPGQLLEVVVKSAADKRNVVVNSNPAEVVGSVTKEWDGLSLASLLPGSLINARVRTVLADGLLVSFLTYFHGTVDPFHLSHSLPGTDWKKHFSEGQKLKARILYINPATKSVGLSLLPHLQTLTLPAPTPMLGQVFEDAVVKRIDSGLGLLLELPLGEVACAGYVHVSNASDDRIEKLDKLFTVGQKVRAQVIGFRLVDGLATLSMKKSVLEQQVASWNELYPGMPLTATVSAIEDFGMIVNISATMKALVPLMHMSELGTSKAKAKFKVGQSVSGRLLDVDADSKRLTMTLKQGLLKSKLPVLASPQQAAPGVKAHGVITGIKDYGVFVTFYGSVRGLAATSELPLQPGQKPADIYTMGQVIKCHVLSVVPATGRIKLGLAGKKAAAAADGANGAVAADPLGGLQPGDVVEGTIRQVPEAGGKAWFMVDVEGPAGFLQVPARLDMAHLADHPAAIEALKDVMKPGVKTGKLVVLERLEGQKQLLVSRKASLVAAAALLPRTFTDVKETAMLPGYVANVTGDAVFVRFLGHVTGRAGLAQLADTFVSDPKRLFKEGQSVRAQIVQVDAEKQRFSATLKPSLTGSTDASFLHSLFRDLEYAEQLAREQEAVDSSSTPSIDWAKELAVGGLVKGSVHEVKDYGVVVDLEVDPDILGVIRPHQMEGSPQPGASVQGMVLDVSKTEGIVDLSVKPHLVKAARDKAAAKQALKAIKPGLAVEAVVELIKEPGYLVLSLPQHTHTLAFASSTDFNQQSTESVTRKFAVGQKLSATLQALPGLQNGGRLLAHVSLSHQPSAAANGAAGGKVLKVDTKPGSLVTATVSALHPCQLDMQLGRKLTGRIHITEVVDLDEKALPSSNPLDNFSVQQSVEGVVLGRLGSAAGRHHGTLELSLRPSLLAAARQGLPLPAVLGFNGLTPGMKVLGLVQEVCEDHLWVVVSPLVRGRVYILDASADPNSLTCFQDTFKVGQGVVARVLQVHAKKHQLDLSLIEPGSSSSLGSASDSEPGVGAKVMGRVTGTGGAGVKVHLGGKRSGRVPLTDIHDVWVDNALTGVAQGAFVRCCVLGKEERGWLLSLRPSKGGCIAGFDPVKAGPKGPIAMAPQSLTEGSLVSGYVKRVDSKGLFLLLDSHTDARIKMNNLSDGFIEDPRAAFPEGLRVEGRIISADSGRIEMSLRAATNKSWRTIKDFKEGEVLSGRVRRVEKYGVFVELQGSNVVGLAHISELDDGPVKDINGMFRPKQSVRAKVLSVDLKAGKLSLGLKPSYFEDEYMEDADEDGKPRKPDIDEEMADVLDDDEDEDDVEASESEDSDDQSEEGEEGEDEDEEGAQHKSAQDVDDIDDIDDVDVMEDDDSDELQPAAAASSDDEADGADDSDEKDDNDDDVGDDGSDAEGDDASDDEDAAGTLGVGNGAGRSMEEAVARNQPGQTSSQAAMELDLMPRRPSWAGLTLVEDEEQAHGARADDADRDAGAGAKKLSKAAKKRAKQEREQQIRQAEMARLQGDNAPKTALDFEQLVLASPNSSFVWIKYMAFLISLGDVDKARALAERALATINYREDQEKFNMWVAWLNLENVYGSPPEEAVMKLFNRAVQYMDQKKLYMAMLDVFQRTQRTELAEQLMKTMVKKFSGSAKVWLRHFEALLHKGDGEGAKKLLDRALSALPMRKHIKVITHAALLEFRAGSAERGRGIFEGVLRNYPKRLDLWSIYLDQEIKLRDAQRIRALFERATHLSLPPKKIKFLFKRYLEYEKAHGDETSINHVKQRAMEFVQNATGIASKP